MKVNVVLRGAATILYIIVQEQSGVCILENMELRF